MSGSVYLDTGGTSVGDSGSIALRTGTARGGASGNVTMAAGTTDSGVGGSALSLGGKGSGVGRTLKFSEASLRSRPLRRPRASGLGGRI